MYEIITQSLTKVVDFTDEELFLFMQRLKPVSLKKYGFYLSEGQVCKSMVIVYKGGMRFFTRNGKGDHTLGFAFEGEWLGDYESFYCRRLPIRLSRHWKIVSCLHSVMRICRRCICIVSVLKGSDAL